MTVTLVKQAIRAFLKTPTPQVLCIRGKWGVGKTFIWDEVLKQAKTDQSVALPYYCHVSLFSLQSIDEIRQAIFENRVTTRTIEIEPSLESLKENVKYFANTAGKQVSRLSSYAKVPYLDRYVANFAGGFRHIVSLAVRETIICFDDFERKKLSAKDLLGLVSQFKEQKGCKAVIILNEDALSDVERVEFRRYFEKVVDIPIEFAPSPTECADIAIRDTDLTSRLIRDNAIALGVSNIRIINRIVTSARDLMDFLGQYGDGTKCQAVHTLTLLIWSKYDDEGIPMSFISGLSDRSVSSLEEETKTEEEKSWLSKLRDYGFTSCDELDLAIMAGIERGFFDDGEIVRQAKLQDERNAVSASHQALYDAWQIFHGSFDDNAADVVEVVYSTYQQHMRNVSRGNLDDAVGVLRTLGYTGKASELISAYIDIHRGSITTVDDTANPFHPVVDDEEFGNSLAAMISPAQPKSLKDILIDIHNRKLRQEDIDIALNASEDDLYRLFKGLKGDEINGVIDGSMSYRWIANATDPQKELGRRSLRALERIGRENPINAIRVRKFSVVVDANKPRPEPLS